MWSWDITFTAPSQSITSETASTTADTRANQTRVRQAAAAAARSESGRNDVQIAARPEPTAIAHPPTRPHRRIVQATVRASEGAVAGVAAR